MCQCLSHRLGSSDIIPFELRPLFLHKPKGISRWLIRSLDGLSEAGLWSQGKSQRGYSTIKGGLRVQYDWLVVSTYPSEKWWTNRQLGWWLYIPNCFWKVIIQPCSSHQPDDDLRIKTGPPGRFRRHLCPGRLRHIFRRLDVGRSHGNPRETWWFHGFSPWKMVISWIGATKNHGFSKPKMWWNW